MPRARRSGLAAAQIYAILEDATVEEAARAYEGLMMNPPKTVLARSPEGFPVLDMMLLGVGPDGHVASLFPNKAATAAKKVRGEAVRWNRNRVLACRPRGACPVLVSAAGQLSMHPRAPAGVGAPCVGFAQAAVGAHHDDHARDQQRPGRPYRGVRQGEGRGAKRRGEPRGAGQARDEGLLNHT